MAKQFASITLSGTGKKFNRDLTHKTRKHDNAISKVVMATAINIIRDTVSPSEFPYITGFLQGSYRAEHRPQRKESVVFSIADYAANVEYGLGQREQKFFRPSLEKNEPLFYDALEKLIEIYK